MTNVWPWWETVFPACNSWLNFLARGQFEIKILIVRHINRTYFIWIFKKIKLEPAIIWKPVPCQRITSKKYLTSMGRHLSPRYGQVILVSGYPVLTAVNWSQYWRPICVHYQFSCAPKPARKYEFEYWSLSSKTNNWPEDSFQINHVTSMSWHTSPRHGHEILVRCGFAKTHPSHPSLSFGGLPYPTRTICRHVRSVNHVTTKRKRLTIFYEHGALFQTRFARMGAPLASQNNTTLAHNLADHPPPPPCTN